MVVDAVASVGAEPLAIDDWQLDLVVLSAQKALAGPAGVSIVTVSPEAWAALDAHPSPVASSVLSLLDWRDRWAAAGRAALPVIPSHLETRALGAAMERVQARGPGRGGGPSPRRRLGDLGGTGAPGPGAVGPPSRRGRLGGDRRARPGRGAAALVPAALAAADDLSAPLSTAPGNLATDALRVNHTGRRATLPTCGARWRPWRGPAALGHDADLDAALAISHLRLVRLGGRGPVRLNLAG